MKRSAFARHALAALGWVLVGSPVNLRACAACFGNSDSPLAEGMNMGIFSLLAVVVFVLGGIATFFVYLVRKSAAVAAAQKITPPSPPPSVSPSLPTGSSLT